MDQKIANFLLAHRHGLATLLYLAQLPRKDARFIGRQKDLYTSRRIEQICLFVLRAIEHETLTEQIQKQRQAVSTHSRPKAAGSENNAPKAGHWKSHKTK